MRIQVQGTQAKLKKNSKSLFLVAFSVSLSRTFLAFLVSHLDVSQNYPSLLKMIN